MDLRPQLISKPAKLALRKSLGRILLLLGLSACSGMSGPSGATGSGGALDTPSAPGPVSQIQAQAAPTFAGGQPGPDLKPEDKILNAALQLRVLPLVPGDYSYDDKTERPPLVPVKIQGKIICAATVESKCVAGAIIRLVIPKSFKDVYKDTVMKKREGEGFYFETDWEMEAPVSGDFSKISPTVLLSLNLERLYIAGEKPCPSTSECGPSDADLSEEWRLVKITNESKDFDLTGTP